jgi:N-acetylmuramic acid 6-phosphate etherase
MSKRRKTGHLITERINPRTTHIDECSSLQIIELISEEDKRVADAIAKEKETIAKAVDLIVGRLSGGGRLFFIGAGTSGRLGVMEAAECPPTFGTKSSLIRGIIAGGKKALWRSIEGAEDSRTESQRALRKLRVDENDVVIGIAASATTPFVEGALSYAKKKGSARVLITCNPGNSPLTNITISLLVGPEVIVGSTRMKAGTATKMVLNILTTASMVRLGKTYGNLMVEVRPNSEKLRDRAKRMIMQILGVNRQKADSLLRRSNWDVKAAVVMGSKKLSQREAKELLARHNGFLREALKSK